MKGVLLSLVLLLVILCRTDFTFCQEKITEEYVVNILDGENRASSAAISPGLAFMVTLPPPDEKAAKSGAGRASATGQRTEELYQRLIPLGRALESNALSRFRFSLVVRGDPGRVESYDESSVQRVAEEIRQFLSAYFAIKTERLQVKGELPLGPPAENIAESKGTQRWRVEVVRLD
jgi:hypothetical protein